MRCYDPFPSRPLFFSGAVYALNKRLGVHDNTFYIYSSDHGFQLGELNLPQDKRNVYEFDIKIHMVMSGPGTKHVYQACGLPAPSFFYLIVPGPPVSVFSHTIWYPMASELPGNFDIILDYFSRISRPHATPRAPRDVRYSRSAPCV